MKKVDYDKFMDWQYKLLQEKDKFVPLETLVFLRCDKNVRSGNDTRMA